MGAWGVAVFSDDLAADVRDEFRALIGEGLSSSEAVDRLLNEYSSSVADDEEKSVFWIALASSQWKLGRLEERTKNEALRLIGSGEDLRRWGDPKDRKKRAAVLEKLREQLVSPQPAPKRVPRTVKGANDWSVGEVVGLQLMSARWTLLRVIGHHEDKSGRYPRSDTWDSVTRARVQAVAAFGFTERQARFLVTVMVHAGCFLERQYCTFTGTVRGHNSRESPAHVSPEVALGERSP